MGSHGHDKNQRMLPACWKALYPIYKSVQFVEKLLGTFYAGPFSWVFLQ